MGTLVWGTAGTISGLQNNQQGNAIAAALAGLSQGATAPSPASTGLASTAGLLWHDTAASQLKLRNQADTAWITLGQIDEANGLFLPVCQATALPALMRGMIGGLTLVNDAALPNTRIDVAAGACADDTGQALMSLAAGIVDFAAAGPDGLDTGALAAGTWYHVFAIMKGDGTTRRLASASLTPALPAGYVYKRRIGSVKTDATGHLLGFWQVGDEFGWKASVLDANAVARSTTPVSVTLSVPPGVNVMAHFVAAISATPANRVWVYTPLMNDEVSNLQEATVATPTTAGASNVVTVRVMTNTSAQVRVVSDDISGSYSLRTLGWRDIRGQF